ncbi:YciI family protein [Xanthomonas nasturtii]|uniref:YciI family protein n=1 Tax=Xanthomonas TaxID=338 RepID=UPI000E1E41A1|nr:MULTISPECIES: YciI family protein [Xanthomonas]MEA9557559.1 YciI family protein [Xanthomonas nasturtii]MEA9563378.1 YciI family protein [Xanthomonas sp. WHRI 8932A]MEA9581162.1 YciI family protein [Xanthomonas nasturtii]MEA9588616.1 YciI family protein [Xanthomonas sp. WHRI 10064B]MEA9613601.1 YciI family protein [Xanthomonas sp. WHRI 10064A]
MKAFLTKWIPPRADFLPTMTEQEAGQMQAHGAWLEDHLHNGRIVAHGPVLDPAGSYGVALWQLQDDQDISELTAQDPIIRAGIGHYAHFPMLQLKAHG